MELAFSIGINTAEFWEMTPYELKISTRGYAERKKREMEEYQSKLENERILGVRQALLISRWVWQKKITEEEIREEMGLEKPKKEEMTDEQMLAQVRMLNKMFGGEEIKSGG